jgi:dTDP-glucose 4,6-dehydratase
MTMAYHRRFKVKTNIARIFNPYGPRMALDDGRVVPAFLNQALQGKPMTIYGKGQQSRSFCFVSDQVDGQVRLAASDEPLPVNLGNPLELTILEFAKRIQRLMGTEVKLEFWSLTFGRPIKAPPGYFQSEAAAGLAAESAPNPRAERDHRIL